MRNGLKKLSICAVSLFLALTVFATELSAAPRMPRGGDDPWTWVRSVSRLLRVILDNIGVTTGNG